MSIIMSALRCCWFLNLQVCEELNLVYFLSRSRAQSAVKLYPGWRLWSVCCRLWRPHRWRGSVKRCRWSSNTSGLLLMGTHCKYHYYFKDPSVLAWFCSAPSVFVMSVRQSELLLLLPLHPPQRWRHALSQLQSPTPPPPQTQFEFPRQQSQLPSAVTASCGARRSTFVLERRNLWAPRR